MNRLFHMKTGVVWLVIFWSGILLAPMPMNAAPNQPEPNAALQTLPSDGKATIPAGPDGSGAFATGHYRNLFVEAGHPQQEVTARINAAFHQLFHGNPDS